LREEDEENSEGMRRGRKIMEEGYAAVKDRGNNEHVNSIFGDVNSYKRRLMLELWISFEDRHASEHALASIVQELRDKLPQQVKKRRRVDEDVMEEYFDLVFPEDEAVQAQGVSKLLAMAKKWKEEQARLDALKQQ
jgi:predicted nucleic acid-binding protein